MLAEIAPSWSIRDTLNYNQHKVRENKAELIFAGNFLKDAPVLTQKDILQRFRMLMVLNPRVKANTLHISMNFSPIDKLSKEKMAEIAEGYMERLGFGAQPYLVYQHRDAGHPHVHIVTTVVKPDGEPISTWLLANKYSEKAKKELNALYGLTPFRGWQAAQQKEEPSSSVQKVQYGKGETARSITKVLELVLNDYCYTSLEELNAILSLYNVKASRGKPGSRIYDNRGLVYQALNDQGKCVSCPIKASFFYFKPTLPFLEKRFLDNTLKRPEHTQHIRTSVSWVLQNIPRDLDDLTARLKDEQIHTVLQKDKEGKVQGMSFVDTKNRTALKGESLGAEYTVERILAVIAMFPNILKNQSEEQLIEDQSQKRQHKI